VHCWKIFDGSWGKFLGRLRAGGSETATFPDTESNSGEGLGAGA